MRLGPGVESDERAVVPHQRAFGELAHVGTDRQVGAIDAVELVGVRMDVDEKLVRMVGRDEGIAVRRRLAEPGTDREDQVGRLDPLCQLRIGSITEIAGIDRRRGLDRVLSPERGGDRDAEAFGEHLEVSAGLRVPPRTADDGDRSGGVRQHGLQRRQRVGAGGLRRVVNERGRCGFTGGLGQHVFGQREHDRAGTTGDGGSVGTGDELRDTRRVVDPRGPLGDRAEERREVDLLEPLAVPHPPRDVADEEDHRLRILEGDVDADAGVGRARPARDEGHARAAGDRAVGAGHESRAAFLPAGDRLDVRMAVERVQHRQEAFARHSKDAAAFLLGKAGDEKLGSGAGHDSGLDLAERGGNAVPTVDSGERAGAEWLEAR